MNLGKIFQKQIYDLLSNKYSVFLLLLISSSIIITAFHFGESWLEWSRDKYSSMFDQFSDNISGQNLQKLLCQSVPIDIVYTWVNGTDSDLLHQLTQVQALTRKAKQSPTDCFYRNCVPSHFLATSGNVHGNILEDIPDAIELQVVKFNHQNWTLISFPSEEAARRARDYQLRDRDHNYTLSLAHWTTDSSAANAVPMQNFVSILGVHSGLDHDGVMHSLPSSLQAHSLWLYLEQGLAIARLSQSLTANILSKSYSNITIDGKEATIRTTFLILKMPSVKNPEDYSASRFEDKEELRYSLRSVEKFAPWVRHIFLVTNGQIPYWLNLDQPRLTIVTHDEIFANLSHLPTFSSPAIESNLHRIPGLSDHFLYLNDDVMFGRKVWPEDFFTETRGQKVYLSWPVPECHEGCPSSWLGDGYCDRACNKSDCMWDGGDCKGGAAAADREGEFGADSILVPDSDGEGIEPWPGAGDEPGSCASNCADSWLADKFCDANCNVFQCGFDAGDCGVSGYHKFHEFILNPDKSQYTLPNGEQMAFWNMSRLMASTIISSGEFDDSPVVRSWAMCHKYQVLTLVLRPGYNASTLHGSISATRGGQHLQINFEVKVNTSAPKLFASTPMYLYKMNQNSSKSPIVLKSPNSSHVIEKLSRNQIRTTTLAQNESGPLLRKILQAVSVDDYLGFLPWEKSLKSFESVRFGRKLLDTFGESLLHVNRLYNREFGFEARRVPAHMAHFIDKNIMSNLHERFPEEWDMTSSHKIRSSSDMQYAFSYFYFLMSEKENVSAGQIFDTFDTDKSGTWSDREIRTVLTRLHRLPLSFSTVTSFEALLINCSEYLPYEISHDIAVPLYERYVDSKMPIVSRELVIQCKEVSSQLIQKFGSKKKYKYEIVGEHDVMFRMLTSNLSQVIGSLDEVRRQPKKFVCLNDNLDPTREKDNNLVRAVLQDFYESILPQPSSFELDHIYRNRFLHVSELRSWRKYRSAIHSATLACIILLLMLTAVLIFQSEGRPWYKRLYHRVRSSGCVCHV